MCSATCSRISASRSLVALEVARQRDERDDGLAGEVVALRDDRGLGDLAVGDDRRLDLGRGEPVAGHVDHVVDAPDDPEVAVIVDAVRRRPTRYVVGPNRDQYVST